MSDRAAGLEERFKSRSDKVIADLADMGIEMRTFVGIRTPHEQAALWRQSRTRAQIELAMKTLMDAGAPKLAAVLESVGPQHGRHVTNALPGDSWHQYGEARDCVWITDGNANWSVDACLPAKGINRKPMNGYREYMRLARAAGLTSGGVWMIQDFPHIQQRSNSKASAVWKWPDIEARMVERFGL